MSFDNNTKIMKELFMHPNHSEHVENVTFITINWLYVSCPYTISLWILLAGVASIIFNISKSVRRLFPESAILIIVGLILGIAMKGWDVDSAHINLTSETFFLFVLPPIVFEAGYSMPNRALFENFDSVLMFSVIGTLWNTLALGGILYCINLCDIFSVKLSIFEILLFASLISAVDPVAVISVFEEISVNTFLYINIFGESLFNDGMSVVLYNMFSNYLIIGVDRLSTKDYLFGVLSFFYISLGGIILGLFFALIVSFITKYTERVRLLATGFVFVVPYLAYLTAEMVGISSIITIVTCAMTMKQYVKGNLTFDAINSVSYSTKLFAQINETVMFMFLGLSTVSSDHHVDLWFIITTLVFALVLRAIGVIAQCFILNRYRQYNFTCVEQFILSYGGIRGSIAYGLAMSLPSKIDRKTTNMFVSTNIAVIYFTVFIQGMTIRPAVNWLKVERKSEMQETFVDTVFNRVFDYTLAGIETIMGEVGHHSIRDYFERINAKFLKPLLTRRCKSTHIDASKLVSAYNKVMFCEAMQSVIPIKKISIRKISTWVEEWKEHERKVSQEQENELNTIISYYLASEENRDRLMTLFDQWIEEKLPEKACRAEKMSAQDAQDLLLALKKPSIISNNNRVHPSISLPTCFPPSS